MMISKRGLRSFRWRHRLRRQRTGRFRKAAVDLAAICFDPLFPAFDSLLNLVCDLYQRRDPSPDEPQWYPPECRCIPCLFDRRQLSLREQQKIKVLADATIATSSRESSLHIQLHLFPPGRSLHFK